MGRAHFRTRRLPTMDRILFAVFNHENRSAVGEDAHRPGAPSDFAKASLVATDMSLHVLAYNLKRAVAVLGTPTLVSAIRE